MIQDPNHSSDRDPEHNAGHHGQGHTHTHGIVDPSVLTTERGIRATGGLLRRLIAMGICPESRVTVVSADRGSLIVSVGESRYALSRGMTMKVLVGMQAAAGAR